MPEGPGTYGSQVGRPRKRRPRKNSSDPKNPMNRETTAGTSITKDGKPYSPTYRNDADADQAPTTPNQGLPKRGKKSNWPGN